MCMDSVPGDYNGICNHSGDLDHRPENRPQNAAAQRLSSTLRLWIAVSFRVSSSRLLADSIVHRSALTFTVHENCLSKLLQPPHELLPFSGGGLKYRTTNQCHGVATFADTLTIERKSRHSFPKNRQIKWIVVAESWDINPGGHCLVNTSAAIKTICHLINRTSHAGETSGRI